MTPRHSALALLVAVLWGVNFVAIDLGLRPSGAPMPPLLFVAMRFALVVFPCIFFIRRPDVSWRAIIGVGLFMSAGQFGLLYLAMALGMPAGLASLVLQAQVLLTVLLAAGILAERPTRRQLAGVVLGIAGLAVVAVGRSLVAPLLPLLIVLAAALSWAAGNIVARKARAASGLGLVVWSGAVVPVPLAGLSLLVDGPTAVSDALLQLQPVSVLSALYTAVFGSLVGYGIWNRLLGLYPSSAVVPFTLLVPVVGMTTAWLVLAEIPSGAEIAGGLLLLSGVAIAVLRPVPRTRPLGVGQRRVRGAAGRDGAPGRDGALTGAFAAGLGAGGRGADAGGRFAAGAGAVRGAAERGADARGAAARAAAVLAADVPGADVRAAGRDAGDRGAGRDADDRGAGRDAGRPETARPEA